MDTNTSPPQSGQVLHAKAANRRLRPASLTKLMTTLVVLDHLQSTGAGLESTWTVTSHAAGQPAVRLGLLAMIPNLLPFIIALGVMGYLRIPLNTYNLIGGSIAIGIAVDDTIHFFHNFRRYYLKYGDINFAVSETLGSAGRAMLATTLILVFSFWMRLFSDLKVVADFGLVVGIALLVAFLADVLLAPALLRILYGAGRMNPLKQFDVPRTQNV